MMETRIRSITESTTTRENTVSGNDQEGIYSVFKIIKKIYFASMMPNKIEDKCQGENTPLANLYGFHCRIEYLNLISEEKST